MTLNSLTTDKPVSLGFQIELEFGNVGFCRGRKTGDPEEKSSEQGREPTTTQPTFDVESGNRTRAILVGGKCSHHCEIPVSTPTPLPTSTTALYFRIRAILVEGECSHHCVIAAPPPHAQLLLYILLFRTIVLSSAHCY